MTLDEARAAAFKADVKRRFSGALPKDARKGIRDIVVQMRRSDQEANFQEALDNIHRAVKPAAYCDDIAEVRTLTL